MPLSLALLSIVGVLASALISFGTDRAPWLFRFVVLGLLAVSGLTATAAGVWVLLTNQNLAIELALGLPWLPWHLRLDALSGFFFAIVGLITFVTSLYAVNYSREFQNSPYSYSTLGVFTGLFIAGMLLVLLADDGYAFMVAWELMSLSSYFLVVYQHLNESNRRAGFLYLLMAHVGGLSILLSFGVMVGFGDGFSFAAMRQAALSPLWASIVFGLAFFGFGMKAGLVPIHAWLPEAHPVAPSHISALMSGVMLKVAIYGFIRVVFDLVGDLLWWWGLLILFVGAASALLGILYALMQNNSKRLLAYSSIENVGIIFTALGLAILFISTGHPVLGALGFLAALYHSLNHALFKSLLFLGAGAIAHSSHEYNLERMGGLIHKLPYTAVFFLIGCISIASLPPFNGFVSEWLIFQTALQTTALESGILRLIIPITAAVLALTGALAVACFVKLYGIAFLGLPRTRHVKHAREVGGSMLASQAILAVLCFLFGIFPALTLQTLAVIPEKILATPVGEFAASSWLWLTPISADVASYSPALLLLGIVVVGFLGWLLLRLKKPCVRRADTWDCGFGGGTARMQYTATSFAMPIRHILSPVWHSSETIDEQRDDLRPVSIKHELHIADRSWPVLYLPILHYVQWVARRIGVVQTGNIRVYLMYSFFTLLAILWIVT